MLPINGRMSEFERCMYISERLKCEEKKSVSENDGVQCMHFITGSLCNTYFLLWVTAKELGNLHSWWWGRCLGHPHSGGSARGARCGHAISVLSRRQSGLSSGRRCPVTHPGTATLQQGSRRPHPMPGPSVNGGSWHFKIATQWCPFPRFMLYGDKVLTRQH